MIIYLDQYRITPVRALKNGTYGTDSTDAQGVSAVVYLFNDVVQQAISPDLPTEFRHGEIEQFLDRAYALATQI